MIPAAYAGMQAAAPWIYGAYKNAQGGGYLSNYFKGGARPDEVQPFMPGGEPPSFGDYTSGAGVTPNREALDFMKDYGTQPLNQQSPWAKMQQGLGERQLDRNLGEIDRQTQAQTGQMMGNVAARGGLDAASAARIGQTGSRAGMQASQAARGNYKDFMSGVGTTDLEQRLGMAGRVAGLEPQYAQQQSIDDRFKYGADFDRWRELRDIYGDAELANSLGQGGSDPMFSGDLRPDAMGRKIDPSSWRF
jgi:hypothetical protein